MPPAIRRATRNRPLCRHLDWRYRPQAAIRERLLYGSQATSLSQPSKVLNFGSQVNPRREASGFWRAERSSKVLQRLWTTALVAIFYLSDLLPQHISPLGKIQSDLIALLHYLHDFRYFDIGRDCRG